MVMLQATGNWTYGFRVKRSRPLESQMVLCTHPILALFLPILHPTLSPVQLLLRVPYVKRPLGSMRVTVIIGSTFLHNKITR